MLHMVVEEDTGHYKSLVTGPSAIAHGTNHLV